MSYWISGYMLRIKLSSFCLHGKHFAEQTGSLALQNLYLISGLWTSLTLATIYVLEIHI